MNSLCCFPFLFLLTHTLTLILTHAHPRLFLPPPCNEDDVWYRFRNSDYMLTNQDTANNRYFDKFSRGTRCAEWFPGAHPVFISSPEEQVGSPCRACLQPLPENNTSEFPFFTRSNPYCSA